MIAPATWNRKITRHCNPYILKIKELNINDPITLRTAQLLKKYFPDSCSILYTLL
jgi:hypothetical protein